MATMKPSGSNTSAYPISAANISTTLRSSAPPGHGTGGPGFTSSQAPQAPIRIASRIGYRAGPIGSYENGAWNCEASAPIAIATASVTAPRMRSLFIGSLRGTSGKLRAPPGTRSARRYFTSPSSAAILRYSGTAFFT